MIEFTSEDLRIEKDFIDFFGHGVPLKQIPSSETTDSVISSMKECLDSHRDITNFIYNISHDVDSIYFLKEG